MDFEDLGIEKIILIVAVLFIVIVVGFFLIKDLTKKNIEENEIINTTNNMNQETNGLKIETLKQGQGNIAKNGDVVSVHYVGTLENGTKFDSSLDRGQPFSFTLGAGQVIKGWDLGVVGMKIGEKRKLTIPPDLGYGDSGVPQANIPPKATLIFEVELLAIN